jgi:uncharacterized protein involved in response to NO
VIAALLLGCGCLHVVRLARWAGYRTFPDRLVLILHLGYAFVPAGYILGAFSALDLIAPSAGIHAWTGGAIGTMTLAVMSRATLEASLTTQAIYAAVLVAALARVCAALERQHAEPLFAVAGVAWAAAFLGFAACYAT